MEDAAALDAAILAAHERQDAENLAHLYHQAALLKLAEGDLPAHGFLLTQAYVFALESGHCLSAELRDMLIQLGREAP
ncbi:hypothetical protein ACFQ14_08355 [Pseudahrensia aquimaris]|uniref:Uncharacterized protein n=1 Tax=Pseudahrensia aquimaris TaxID=744461 RepID=A0ABW3FHQ5_9HYPH